MLREERERERESRGFGLAECQSRWILWTIHWEIREMNSGPLPEIELYNHFRSIALCLAPPER